MAMNNYILLIRKADFIDFFKNGKMNGSFCASEKFDGNTEKLPTNSTLASKVFKKANAFDYSIDYLLMHVISASLSKLTIFDIQAIYALDEDSYQIGLDMNPPVALNTPIWQEYYQEYQISQSIAKAQEGVEFLSELFGWTKTPTLKKFTKKDLQETFRELYFEERPEGDLSIWTYLLRYERHEAYPKEPRGFVLDALHVYGNFSRKMEVNKPVTMTKTGTKILESTQNKIPSIIEEVFTKEFLKNVKSKKIDPRYFEIASLYLLLKETFINGINPGEQYYGKSLDDFIEYLKEKNEDIILQSAIYLLGLTLGRDNIYKYMYARDAAMLKILTK